MSSAVDIDNPDFGREAIMLRNGLG